MTCNDVIGLTKHKPRRHVAGMLRVKIALKCGNFQILMRDV